MCLIVQKMSLAKTLHFYVTKIQLQDVQQLYEIGHEFWYWTWELINKFDPAFQR